MKFFQSTVLFLFFSTIIFAQKSYLIHITIDKIVLGKDSVVFKKGKTFLVDVKSHTDTIEIVKIGNEPVAMVLDVRRVKEAEKIKYQIGYAFYKKQDSKWILVHKFPYVNRYELSVPIPGLEKVGAKKNAHEEFHCSLGLPQNFEAFFRMDVYKK